MTKKHPKTQSHTHKKKQSQTHIQKGSKQRLTHRKNTKLGGSKPTNKKTKNGIKAVKTKNYDGLCPTTMCRMCSDRAKFPVEYFYCTKCYRLYQKHTGCPFKRLFKKPKKLWIKSCCSNKKNVKKIGEVRKDNSCDFYPPLVDYIHRHPYNIDMIPCRVHDCKCESYTPVDPDLATKPLDSCKTCPHLKVLHTTLNTTPPEAVKISSDDVEGDDSDED